MADFYPADVGRAIIASGGVGTITGYTDGQHVTVEITQAFPTTAFDSGSWVLLGSPMASLTPSAATPAGAAITLTLSAGGWRPSDVGSYVRINGGLCKIASLTSDTIANATIESVLNTAVAAPALAWTLERAAWGGSYGYPRCGTIYESRHWLAGSPGFPVSLWGSVIGEFYDFTIGTLDDEAIFWSLGNGENNPILHLVSIGGLLALTSGSEWSLRGGQEKPISPTNVRAKDQSNYGSSEVEPVRVGQEVYFPQRAGRKIRAISPNQYSEEQYVAPDMSVLSEHVTLSRVTALAYQAEPDALLFAVRTDGQLASLTADREQDVFAWSRQRTEGNYESVASVPTSDGNRVFVSVARTIEGVTTRYTEMFEEGLHTDSAITGSSDVGATVWGGLTHLKGRTVQAKGDGVYLGEFTVNASGQITTPRTVFELEVGLPYTTTVKTLTPELMAPGGSAQGHQLSIHEVKVRLLETTGCAVNLQQIGFVKTGLGVLDRAPPVFSGDKLAGNLGWGDGVAQTLIQQTLPYDFHLLSVITRLTANEG